MVETLVRARKIYLHRYGDAGHRSAATAAVDQWVDNINRRAMDNAYRPTTKGTVFAATNTYFADAKTKYLQVDSANMLSRPVMDEPRIARKRSPSPTWAGPPPSAKRRSSETRFERRGFSPASAPLPLPPLKTDGSELRILGQARQVHQTPISANDGMRHGDRYSRGHSSDLADKITVRGYARRDSLSSPSIRPPTRDAAPESESRSGKLEQVQTANGLLRDRIAKLETKLAAAMAGPRKDEASGEMEKRLAVFEKKLASMEGRTATKETVTPDIKAVLASFEEQLIQAEERRAKDMEKAGAMIASLESKLPTSGSEESSPRQAETIRDLQSRIASLEAKVTGPGILSARGAALHGEQTQIASVESGLDVAAAQLKEEGAPVIEHVTKRLASLEDRLLPAHGSAHEKWGADDMSTKIMRVEARLTLDEAATKAIDNRVSSLDKQHLESAKLAASKTFVEVNSKRLDDRLSTLERQQQEADEHKARDDATLKAIEDRVVALETQGTRLLKITETPKSPKSPSPLRDVQHNMEDIWKKIKGLPTMTSVSEKTFQIEQHLRALLEQHRRDINERLEGAVKELGDVKAQIKGLLKLLDDATSSMAKSESVTALKGELAILSRKLDSACQSVSRNAQVEELERKVKDLGSDVQQVLRAISSEDLATRLQELYTRVDGIEQSVEVAKKDDLAREVASLHDRCNTLTAGLKGLLFEYTKTGN